MNKIAAAVNKIALRTHRRTHILPDLGAPVDGRSSSSYLEDEDAAIFLARMRRKACIPRPTTRSASQIAKRVVFFSLNWEGASKGLSSYVYVGDEVPYDSLAITGRTAPPSASSSARGRGVSDARASILGAVSPR